MSVRPTLRFLALGTLAVLGVSVAGLAILGGLHSPAEGELAAGVVLPQGQAGSPCDEVLLTVPALSPWAAVVMAMLMLTASTFALYGGNIAKRKHVVGGPGRAKPLGKNPVAARSRISSGRKVAPDRGKRTSIFRERSRTKQTHSPTSLAKKRRAGPGCRGPLRKT